MLFFWGDGKINIGDYKAIGDNNIIHSSKQGGIYLGKDVLIAANCYLIDSNHKFDSNDLPIRLQGFSHKPIFICDNVWIGVNTTVLPGVTISKGCVIGANSLVNKSLSSDMIAFGSPAKEIKKRI